MGWGVSPRGEEERKRIKERIKELRASSLALESLSSRLQCRPFAYPISIFYSALGKHKVLKKY